MSFDECQLASLNVGEKTPFEKKVLEWFQRNSKIPKGQTVIVKTEDRKDHGLQNEMKNKHRSHNTTLRTKAGVTRTLQKPPRVQVLRKGKQLLPH